MELNAEDQQRIREWLESRLFPGFRCFLCGDSRWAMQPKAAMTVMYDTHTGRINYMDGYPMIGLICGRCAHIEWFSAPMMGLQPIPPEAAAQGAESTGATVDQAQPTEQPRPTDIDVEGGAAPSP